jgi:hypothetical protein
VAFFGEAVQLAQPFIELSPRHERAAALFAADVPRLSQHRQGLPHCIFADLKPLRKLLFARQALIRTQAARLNFGF